MRTELCDLFDIEVPIFAFSHCRDVVAAVCNAGGFGVLGALAVLARAARDRVPLDRRARRRQAVRCRYRDAHASYAGKDEGLGRRPTTATGEVDADVFKAT